MTAIGRRRLRVAAALLAALMLHLCAAPVGAQEGPCAGGCDLDGAALVCGADGNTYQGACLAECQGIAVTKSGPCTRADAKQFDTKPRRDAAGGGAAAPGGSGARYKEEGFFFVGRSKGNPRFKPAKLRVKLNRDGTPVQGPAAPFVPSATRIVFDTGFVYRTGAAGSALLAALRGAAAPETSAEVAEAGGSAPDEYPGFDPTIADGAAVAFDDAALAALASLVANGTEGGNATAADMEGARRRLLGVLGADDRVRVTPTTAYPWRAHGLLQTGNSGCSGGMISPSSLLTAAHCVHSGRGGTWGSNVRFSPGADASNRPYGTVAYEYMTTYSRWITNGCGGSCTLDRFMYDMAVVRLAQPVGLNVGWLGMIPSDTFSATLTSAGYPGDKPSGTMCDIIPGQSGSPVWENRNGGSPFIRGIVSFGGPTMNGLQQLTRTRFLDALAWSNVFATSWNDAGSRDGYKSIYLDRHDLSLCSSATAMSSFQLQTSWGGTPQMRVAYSCAPPRGRSALGAAAARSTPAGDWGGGNAVFLDRHDVRCAANQALTRWRLQRPTGSTIRFEFWCAPVTFAAGSCENLATPWNANGGGQVVFLDRHPVTCPGDKVLQGWRLNTNNAAGQYRIAYTCCLPA
ncbi:MAG: hypothetical protein J3K34DRAFT_474337 [Monoraphidium minutum]|nr:MAG: hypothetical protein J3K34DRAFT_474337 [Monoraphidium minutum]